MNREVEDLQGRVCEIKRYAQVLRRTREKQFNLRARGEENCLQTQPWAILWLSDL